MDNIRKEWSGEIGGPLAMSIMERVTDPESPALKEFHEFLGRIFDSAELEPLESYREELGRHDPDVHFLCFNAKDAKGEIKSCAYGSLIKDLLAVRFVATEVTNRGTGISQSVNWKMIEEAKKLGAINSIVCEAVERSEAYWNRLEIFEYGNSMRRIYYADPTGQPDPAKQVYYRLPPFEWNSDGTPVNDPRQFENLQIAVRGHKDKIPVEKLKEILRLWWQKWYVRPRAQFESDQAFQKHEAYVMDTLENGIIQLVNDSGQEYVVPMSQAERLWRAGDRRRQ